MLTNKGKYGLKAMLHLARVHQDEIAQVAQIAKDIRKNNRYDLPVRGLIV
jgi:DNA-binding IscR family transcriptional regulator